MKVTNRWQRGWLIALAVCGIWPLAANAEGGGTFHKYGRQFTVGPNPSSVAAVDLNGDDLPEIITGDVGTLTGLREERPAHDQLSLLVARGNLAYEPQPQLQTGFAPYDIAVANIDTLKAQDLLVANFHDVRSRHLTLFRNLDNNLFEAIHFRLLPEGDLPYYRMLDGDGAPAFTTPGVTSLAVADINRDGFRDVIATGWSSDVIIFLPGVADTYFGQPAFIRAPGGPRDVQIADFDRDGALDLVTVQYVAGEVALWKGDGTGHFTLAERFASRGRLPEKAQVADFNGDGRLDIAVGHCHADDSIVLFFGDGGFRFSASQEILLGENRDALEQEIRDLVAEDFNHDGKADLAAACHTGGQVVALINVSQGSGIPQEYRREHYPFEDANPRALCVADVDRNGGPDLVVALWKSNSVALLLGEAYQPKAAPEPDAKSGKDTKDSKDKKEAKPTKKSSSR